MKNKKILIPVLVGIMLLSGCGNKETSSETLGNISEISESTQISEDSSSKQENTSTETEEATPILKENPNKNISKVADILAKDANDGNVVVSDLSINMALSMALEGAEGDTKKELEDYLGLEADKNSLYNKQILDSLNKNKNTIFTIANSFWYTKKLNVKDEYIDNVKNTYNAEIQNVDFKDSNTAKMINDWCSENTNKLIKQIVSPEDIKDCSNIITNALYFKGNWIDEFYKDGNTKETFNSFNEKTEVDMMHSTESTYVENDKAIGFIKYYYDNYAFVGILPKAEGDFELSSLNIDELLASKTTDYDVRVSLPKFKVEYKTSLNNALSDMNVNKMFTKEADFSNMAEDDLLISKIVHKTYISVDEIGTEAAAVTALSMETCGIEPEKEIKEVNLNRPFAFAIVDMENNQSLFIGKICTIK